MNEELNSRLLSSLDKVATWLESAEDFAVEQAPLVAQEVLHYSFWAHGLDLAILAIPTISAASLVSFGLWAVSRELRNSCGSEDRLGGALFLAACSSVALLFLSIGVVHHVREMMQITLAPRMFLLEYVQGLL